MSENITAHKLDMTQQFSEDGVVTPVTAIHYLEGDLHVGDVLTVTGVSKGKGFAGVVKRYSFSGGPKTHGQSDRHRAVGSIGQGTSPGRVYKGKKMPGQMGHEKVTLKNIEVLGVNDGNIAYIKGPIPGSRSSVLSLKITQRAPMLEESSNSENIIEEVETKQNDN